MTVINKMYVQYDDTGQVHYINNFQDPVLKNFEIDLELVLDFLSDGTKDSKKYKINYFFNLSKGVIEHEAEETENHSALPFVISRTTSYNNEITLDHNLQEFKWTIHVRQDIMDQLTISSNLVFFICKKDDPHYLYSTLTVQPNNLKTGKFDLFFIHDHEKDINSISVVPIRSFKSYGLKEIK
jgi:hypothetical protein